MSGMLIAAAAAVYLFFQKSAPETLGDLEAQIVRAKQAGTADTSVVGAPRRDTSAEVEALEAKVYSVKSSLAATPGVRLVPAKPLPAKPPVLRILPGRGGTDGRPNIVEGDLTQLQAFFGDSNIGSPVTKVSAPVVSLGGLGSNPVSSGGGAPWPLSYFAS